MIAIEKLMIKKLLYIFWTFPFGFVSKTTLSLPLLFGLERDLQFFRYGSGVWLSGPSSGPCMSTFVRLFKTANISYTLFFV